MPVFGGQTYRPKAAKGIGKGRWRWSAGKRKGQTFTIGKGPQGIFHQYPGAKKYVRPKATTAPPKPKATIGVPPAPAAPKPQAQPADPLYDVQVGGAKRRYEQALAELQYQKGRTRQEFGFEDTSNPYNRAAMLERSYKQGQQRTLGSMASAGQLYSGALQSGLEEGTRGFSQNTANLRRAYEDALHGYTRKEAEAKGGYEESLGTAAAEKLQRAVEQRPEDYGEPELAPISGAPAAAKAPKGSKKKGIYKKRGITYKVKGLGKPISKRKYVVKGKTLSRKQWVGYVRKRGKKK
jgi:hypothetical protein